MYILKSYLHDTMSEIQEHPNTAVNTLDWPNYKFGDWHCKPIQNRTDVTVPQHFNQTWHQLTDRDWSNLGYVHTIPDSSFCAGTEIVPDIGLLFTHKNCCGSAISVTEQCCTAPISKVERLISDRICSIPWSSVNTRTQPVAEVNK